MTGNTRKQLSSNFATLGHTFPSSWIGLVAVLIFAGVNSASAIVAVDQQTVSNQFNSGLRVQTFVPVGQTFIPTVSWHVGVELLLSMSCSSPPLPPAIYTVQLREQSLAGPILASGTTQPFVCPELSSKQWVEILFDEPVALVPGDTYFLTVTTANIAGFWWRAGLDPYPDGAAFVNGSLEANFDWGFRTLANIVDAFQCYRAKAFSGHPRSRGRRVHLSDQFGDKVVRVGRGVELCVPVDRFGEGIAEPDANLMCYDIRERRKPRERRKHHRGSDRPGREPIEVRVTNEFGVEPGLIVKRPKRLCVPSTTSDPRQLGPVVDPANLQLDHFQCYRVAISPNLPRQFPLRLPEALCTPVDKNSEGILDPATHLTCYDNDGLGEPLPPNLNRKLRVSNQFGSHQLYSISAPTHLCVPSTKEVIEPPPDPPGHIVIDDPIFFDLPINSIRYAVSGYDAETDLCVTAVFPIRDSSDFVKHCDDFGPNFPYLVIAPGEPAGCFAYGSPVELLSVNGCVDFAAFNFPIIPGADDAEVHTDEVDLTLEVSSDVFSGTVHFDSPEPEPDVCDGLLGLVCLEGEVCIHPPGTCRLADGSGICVARPEACLQIYDPVCGCDHRDYPNECTAHMFGVSILRRGICAGPL